MRGYIIFQLLFINFFPVTIYAYSSGTDPLPGIGAVQQSTWAAFGNPAGLAKQESFSAAIFYHSLFKLKETATTGLAMVVPVKKVGVAGMSFSQYGYSLYSEQSGGVSLARSFGNLSAGLRFDFLRVHVGDSYGNKSGYSATAGILFSFTEQIKLGVSINNPSHLKEVNSEPEIMPAIFNGALSWLLNSNTEITAGIKKTVGKKEILQAQLLYHVVKRFSLRAGVASSADQFYFGYLFRFGNVEIGMHSGYHSLLGFSPQVQINYTKK
jgi:hypothetical protein